MMIYEETKATSGLVHGLRDHGPQARPPGPQDIGGRVGLTDKHLKSPLRFTKLFDVKVPRSTDPKIPHTVTQQDLGSLMLLTRDNVRSSFHSIGLSLLSSQQEWKNRGSAGV